MLSLPSWFAGKGVKTSAYCFDYSKENMSSCCKWEEFSPHGSFIVSTSCLVCSGAVGIFQCCAKSWASPHDILLRVRSQAPPPWTQAPRATRFPPALFLSSSSVPWNHHFLAILLLFRLSCPAFPYSSQKMASWTHLGLLSWTQNNQSIQLKKNF